MFNAQPGLVKYLFFTWCLLFFACTSQPTSEITYHPDVPTRSLNELTVEADPDHVFKPGEFVRTTLAIETQGSSINEPLTRPVEGDPANDIGYAKLHVYLINKDEFESAPEDVELSTVYFVIEQAIPAYANGTTTAKLEFYIPLGVLQSGTYLLTGIVESPEAPFDQADSLYKQQDAAFTVTSTEILIDATTAFHDHRLVRAESADAAGVFDPTDGSPLNLAIHADASFWGRAGYTPTTSEEGERFGELQHGNFAVQVQLGDQWKNTKLVDLNGALKDLITVTYESIGSELPFDFSVEVSAGELTAIFAEQGVTDLAALETGDFAGNVSFQVQLSDPDGKTEDITGNNTQYVEVPIYILRAPTDATNGAPGLRPGAPTFQPDYNNWIYQSDALQIRAGKYVSGGSRSKLFGLAGGHQNLLVNTERIQADMGTIIDVAAYGNTLKFIGIDIDAEHINGSGFIETRIIVLNKVVLASRADTSDLNISIPDLEIGVGQQTTPSFNINTNIGDPEVRDFNQAIESSDAYKIYGPFGFEKRRVIKERQFVIGPVPLVVEVGAIAYIGGGFGAAFPSGRYYFGLQAPAAEAGLYGLGGIGTSLLSGGVASEGILARIAFESVFSGELKDANDNALYERYTELAFTIRLLRAKLGLYLKQSWWSLKWCKKSTFFGKIWYPCGWRKKTNYYHLWLYKTPFLVNATFPVYSDVKRFAVLPVYDTMSPTAVQLGFGAIDFVFEGDYFNSNVKVVAIDNWCTGLVPVEVAYAQKRTRRVFRCTPVKSGIQKFRIEYDDGRLRGEPSQEFSVNATPAPVIQTISQSVTDIIQGELQTISVNGQNLTPAITISGFTACDQPILQAGGTSTQRVFTCTALSPGSGIATISDGNTSSNFNFNVLNIQFSASILDNTPPFMDSPASGDHVVMRLTGNNMVRPVEVISSALCQTGTLVHTVTTTTLQEFECTAQTVNYTQSFLAQFRLGNATVTRNPLIWRPQIQSVIPTSVGVSVPTTFTVSGIHLQSLDVYFPSCTGLTIPANPAGATKYANQLNFSCTVTQPGTFQGTVTSHNSTYSLTVMRLYVEL